jgi:hypothetical protein
MRGCGTGYGKEWEEGHPYCVDCPDEYTCRDRTIKRRRLEKQQRPASTTSSSTVSGSRSTYSYTTNKTYLMPMPGESPFSRIIKNIISGMISAFGGEVYSFWQEWRLPPDQPIMQIIPRAPQQLPPSERPPSIEAPKREEVQEKQPEHKTIRVAKRPTISVSDDLEDYDDLDDL